MNEAQTFEDSLAVAVGNRLGYIALFDLVQNVPDSIDREEMWRGAMTVMNADTANVSYLYGLATGELLMRNYRLLSSRANVDKDLYLRAARTAFMRSDLPTDAELQEVVELYNLMYDQLEARERAAADAEVFNTEEARQNRMLADAVEAQLKADPAYEPVGNTGMLINVATPGTGASLTQVQYPVVDITLSRIDSGSVIVARQGVMVAMNNCQDPLLASVLPLLSQGETATVYVPYQYAYGVQGQPTVGIGPCESVMATITVNSAK